MCVIIYKEKGHQFSENFLKEDLPKLWKHNPDGGGIAVKDGKDVYYQKGYMSFKKFKKDWLGFLQDCKDVDVGIHFRIATSGKTDKFRTHPFRLEKSLFKQKKLFGHCSCLFHNGVFHKLGDKVFSDTQHFIKKHHKILRKGTQKDIEKLPDVAFQRLLIFREDAVIRTGNWELWEEGVWLSNTHGLWTGKWWERYGKLDWWYDRTEGNSEVFVTYGRERCDICGEIDVVTYDAVRNLILCRDCFTFINNSEELKKQEKT